MSTSNSQLFSRTTVLGFVLLATIATPAPAEKKPPYPVIAYVYAWEKPCNSVVGYQLVGDLDSSNYQEAIRVLKKGMAEKYPKANFNSGYSGPNDVAVAVAEVYSRPTESCPNARSFLFRFGVNQAAALSTAEADAKAVDHYKSHKIIDQRFIVKTTTAP